MLILTKLDSWGPHGGKREPILKVVIKPSQAQACVPACMDTPHTYKTNLSKPVTFSRKRENDVIALVILILVR